MDCCIHNQDMSTYFGGATAQREASQYLKKGLASHASALIAAVAVHGVEGATVLEVGSGIGSLSVELLKRGAACVTHVEVSSAYLAAAQALAGQLGLGERVRYHRADLACDADSIPAADIVIMHRVICCYPDMPRLVSAAAQRARRVLALSFPRDEWYMRLYIEVQAKWMRMRGSRFRNYVHSPDAIFRVGEKAELRPVHQSYSGTWQIVVFER